MNRGALSDVDCALTEHQSELECDFYYFLVETDYCFIEGESYWIECSHYRKDTLFNYIPDEEEIEYE